MKFVLDCHFWRGTIFSRFFDQKTAQRNLCSIPEKKSIFKKRALETTPNSSLEPRGFFFFRLIFSSQAQGAKTVVRSPVGFAFSPPPRQLSPTRQNIVSISFSIASPSATVGFFHAFISIILHR
jgi:hypothetical protein